MASPKSRLLRQTSLRIEWSQRWSNHKSLKFVVCYLRKAFSIWTITFKNRTNDHQICESIELCLNEWLPLSKYFVKSVCTGTTSVAIWLGGSDRWVHFLLRKMQSYLIVVALAYLKLISLECLHSYAFGNYREYLFLLFLLFVSTTSECSISNSFSFQFQIC